MKADEICHVETTTFHNQLESENYPFESGRYWLFTSKVCPFAHRTEIARALTGLTKEIGLTITDAVQTAEGWNIEKRYESADSSACPVAGLKRLPELYQLAAADYAGRASVPVLFDTKTDTIVNNESAEIIRQFDAVGHTDQTPLYPKSKRALIDELIDGLANELITPIYRAGFAKDQQTYLCYFKKVFSYLDTLEERLKKTGPYLAGEQLTLADIHAYPHVARFDAVYHSLYRLNLKYISDFPGITDYMNRLGEIPAFANTLDLAAVKEGYFLACNQPTDGYVIPAGPVVDSKTGVRVVAFT
jgi:putative glutathione S-transferase